MGPNTSSRKVNVFPWSSAHSAKWVLRYGLQPFSFRLEGSDLVVESLTQREEKDMHKVPTVPVTPSLWFWGWRDQLWPITHQGLGITGSEWTPNV